MSDLLQNGTFLAFSMDLLKLISWILGAYFITLGILDIRRGWATQSKRTIFRANLFLILGLLFVLFLIKSIVFRFL